MTNAPAAPAAAPVAVSSLASAVAECGGVAGFLSSLATFSDAELAAAGADAVALVAAIKAELQRRADASLAAARASKEALQTVTGRSGWRRNRYSGR